MDKTEQRTVWVRAMIIVVATIVGVLLNFLLLDILVLWWVLAVLIWKREEETSMYIGASMLVAHIIVRIFIPDAAASSIGLYGLTILIAGAVVAFPHQYRQALRRFWHDAIRQSSHVRVRRAANALERVFQSARDRLRAVNVEEAFDRHVLLNAWRTWPLPLKVKVSVLAVLFIGVAALTTVPLMDVLILLFFVAGILFHWDGRCAVIFGLACLASVPLLLIARSEPTARALAVYAFDFFVIGTTEELIRVFREQWGQAQKPRQDSRA